MIERLWGGPETLFIVSTDLSHYHRYDEARALDQSTLSRIAAFDTDINHEEACGATPLNGFLAAARARGLSIRLLGACNSGDTAGGRERVVGYSAFALYEGARVAPAARRARRCSRSRARRSRTGSGSGPRRRARSARPGSRSPAPPSSR